MTDQKAKWTIMIYISADNILVNFAVESLKQLKRSAGDRVVVAAQVDASKRNHARRYLFDAAKKRDRAKEQDSSISNNLVPIEGRQPSQEGIADPLNLTDFITWALKHPKCQADHYCLFLWGHGYELLLDEDQPGDAGAAGRNYLTPKNLGQALKGANLESRPLDIIGIDACAMSLIELATELEPYGRHLTASQDDVPDLSFPYEEMLSELSRLDLDDVEGICAAIPKLYKQAYQDYLMAPGSGIGERTLTSLRLEQVSTVAEPLKKLATALNVDSFDVELGTKIHTARQDARGFALGMFVDLFDFCSKLAALEPSAELTNACNAVCEAVDGSKPQSEPRSKPGRGLESTSHSEVRPFVLENQTSKNGKSQCHGLSIYFPYLQDKEQETVRESLAAGPKTADVQLPLLTKGGPIHLEKARSVRISEMETDFADLRKFQEETGWSKFIQQGWSFILATKEPYNLDLRYSGQQAARNMAAMVENIRPTSGVNPSIQVPLASPIPAVVPPSPVSPMQPPSRRKGAHG